MDHFRPKSNKKKYRYKGEEKLPFPIDNEKNSYWWLTFDWKNYRLSAQIPNRNKSNYFPLREGSCVARSEEELIKEDVVILDPTNKEDVELIGFDEEGKVVFAGNEDEGELEKWNFERVKISIDIYKLNDQSLCEARRDKIKECKEIIEDFVYIKRKCKEKTYEDKERIQKKVKKLQEILSKKSEYTSVARKYIKNNYNYIKGGKYALEILKNVEKKENENLQNIILIENKC